jgi:hypothetical protein
MTCSESLRRNNINIFLAIIVFGFTMGLFTGWSRAPVVGSLLSGTIGLVSGVVLAMLGTKGETNLTNRTAYLVVNNLGSISRGITILCLSTVAGTVLGINVRNGYIPILIHSQEPLIPITTKYAILPPGITAKLVVLQHAMDSIGHERSENNLVIDRYAKALMTQVPLSSDSYLLSNALDVLLDFIHFVKANGKLIADLDCNGLNCVKIESTGLDGNTPGVLINLSERSQLLSIERIEAIRELLIYKDGDVSLADNERHLDFLLERVFAGLQSQKIPSEPSPAAAPNILIQ